MLLLLDTGTQEELILDAFGITFRKPSQLEKEHFYKILGNKKADSNWSLFDEIKENVLVIEYKYDKKPLLGQSGDYEKNMLAFEKFNEEKRKIGYILYFLFSACDIFEHSSFLSHPSSIRLIDLYNLDSRLYDKIVLETLAENMIWRAKIGKNLFHLNDMRKSLETFNILFKECSGQYNINYFYYVGELISSYIQTDSIMMRFTILTSIIEFFIVHKGSNTEQFKFKTSLVTNKLRGEYFLENNPLRGHQLPRYEDDIAILDTIYNIRSRIIHGDLSNVKIKSKEFMMAFSNLQFFVASILHQYMLNPGYIEFIKKNG